MKKLNFVYAFLLISTLAFFAACGTDEETTPPSIMFNAATGYTTSDVTVPAKTALKIGIIASKTSAKLTNMKITQTVNNVPTTVQDSTFSSDSYSIDFNVKAPAQVATVKYTFKITAADGESAEISLSITTTAGPVTSYTQKILGSYDNTTSGSSFASATGTVYALADAKTNAAKVDWMYYYGSTGNLATLVAPVDATASSVYSGANGPASWSVRNDTKLAKVTLPTGVTWDNITTDAEIIPLATGLTETKVNNLAVGQIVSFKTVTGKMGLIKIDAITGTAAGSITYSVKVQQ